MVLLSVLLAGQSREGLSKVSGFAVQQERAVAELLEVSGFAVQQEQAVAGLLE